MNSFESNNIEQATASEKIGELNKSTMILDQVPYEDFIFQAEEEILLEEIDKENKNVKYLKSCLTNIKARKENFLKNIETENRKLSASALFGIREVILKNLIYSQTENNEVGFKIEGSKWQQEIIFLINNIKNNHEELQIFWDEYKTLFDYEEDRKSGNKYMSGILAPLALQNILKEKYGVNVSYPKPEEDVKYSVDMVAGSEDMNFLIQVKTDKKAIDDMLERDFNASNRGIRLGQEDGKEFIKVLPRYEFGKTDNEIDDDYKRFSNGCLNFVKNKNRIFEKENSETKGVYMYVPCFRNGKKIVGLNGVPDDEVWKILVAEGLESKLGLPKRFDYDSVLRKQKSTLINKKVNFKKRKDKNE